MSRCIALTLLFAVLAQGAEEHVSAAVGSDGAVKTGTSGPLLRSGEDTESKPPVKESELKPHKESLLETNTKKKDEPVASAEAEPVKEEAAPQKQPAQPAQVREPKITPAQAKSSSGTAEWADGESPAREELKHAMYFVLFLILTVFGAGLVYYILVQRKALLSTQSDVSKSGSSISEQSSSMLKSPLKKYDDGSTIPDSDSVSEDSSEKIAYLFNRVRTSLENLNQKSQEQSPQ